MNMFDKYPGNQLIGFSGTLGAGKDTGAQHLVEKHGFMHVSSGDVLRAEARSRGLDTQRTTLIEIGKELRAAKGMGALSLRGMELWEQRHADYAGGLIVSGLRSLGESREIKTQRGRLALIDAPIRIRFDEMLKRARDDAVYKTIEDFKEHEELELHGLLGPDSPHLLAVRAIADVVIINPFNEMYIPMLDMALGLPVCYE